MGTTQYFFSFDLRFFPHHFSGGISRERLSVIITISFFSESFLMQLVSHTGPGFEYFTRKKFAQSFQRLPQFFTVSVGVGLILGMFQISYSLVKPSKPDPA